ncbi:DUF4180 domain-containing protein [Actinocatenispora rupis]
MYDGPRIATTNDALDLIGAAFLGAEVVAVPADRLSDDFFALGTRFAGEVMQKFVNYRLRLAVVGDISRQLADSAALRALVHESNRADHVWFVPDLATLDAKLAGVA